MVDESRCAITLGGSKVRSLEWLLGDALVGGGDVVTLGPAGGQHLLASAVYGKRVGLRVHAVAWPQPRSEAAERALRVLHAHAEHVWPASSRAVAALVVARAVATTRFLAGYAPLVWPPGGSSAVGTLGWVEGGLDLGRAIRDGTLHDIRRVYVPMGSGGLAAGLSLGLALSGAVVEVVAIDVAGGGRMVFEGVRWATSRLLARRGLSVPKPAQVRFVRETSAYGVATAPGAAAAAVAAESGVFVDATYGAKTLAVALRDAQPERCAFVATANARSMGGLLAGALTTVPQRLAGLLQ